MLGVFEAVSREFIEERVQEYGAKLAASVRDNSLVDYDE